MKKELKKSSIWIKKRGPKNRDFFDDFEHLSLQDNDQLKNEGLTNDFN